MFVTELNYYRKLQNLTKQYYRKITFFKILISFYSDSKYFRKCTICTVCLNIIRVNIQKPSCMIHVMTGYVYRKPVFTYSSKKNTRYTPRWTQLFINNFNNNKNTLAIFAYFASAVMISPKGLEVHCYSFSDIVRMSATFWVIQCFSIVWTLMVSIVLQAMLNPDMYFSGRGGGGEFAYPDNRHCRISVVERCTPLGPNVFNTHWL